MKRALLLLSLVSLCTAACARFQRADLRSARTRWNAAHLTHYRYTVNEAASLRLGFELMPISIEVRSDGVILMADKNGTPLTDDAKQLFDEYAPMARLFDWIEADIGTVYQLDVGYDPTYGFPSGVKVDYVKGGYDDESYAWITDFQPLP